MASNIPALPPHRERLCAAEELIEVRTRLTVLEQTMATASDKLNPQLAKLEQVPVRTDLSAAARATVVEGEPKTYQQLIDDAQGVRLGSLFERLAEEPLAETDLWMLERQQIALMYRANARKPQTPREGLLAAFTKIIERYKKNPDLYPGGNGQLTDYDRTQIARVCNDYPVFVEALLRRHTQGVKCETRGTVMRMHHQYNETNNDPWTEGFIKFCLRSPGASGIDAPEWIKIFVEYPKETDALMGANLDKRIGAVDPSMLSLRPQPDQTLLLSIKVDNAWKRVQGVKKEIKLELNGRVVLNHVPTPAYPLTMQEVYQQMRAKRSSYENVEVFQEGVLSWNSILLGSFNRNTQQIDQIDVNQPDWLLQLPAWRVVDEAQLMQRYNGQVRWPSAGARYAFAVCATRTTPDLNIPACHGFFEVIVPDQDGKFRILPFGFQPPVLPDSTLDKLCAMQNTQPGMLHYPDESSCLSNRQRYAEFFPIDGAEFQALQKHLAHFVTKARAGKEVFQPTGNNCARHVQKVYDVVVGQRFYGKFEELVESLFPDREVHEEVKAIRKELDDEALAALSKEVADHLVGAKDQQKIKMASLLHLCVTTLGDVLKINGTPIAAYKITEAEALQKIQTLYADNPEGADAILKNDLQRLITLCFESQQFYKMSVYDAELKEDIIGPIFDFIRNIRSVWWLWLRDFLFSFLGFILGSWRSISYEKEDGTTKTINALNHPYQARVLNLPAKVFYRPEMMDKWRGDVNAILSRLTNSRRSS